LDFTDADISDRAQNELLFNKIDKVLNSGATEEFTWKVRLNIVRGYS
jgi:hypothetical protein